MRTLYEINWLGPFRFYTGIDHPSVFTAPEAQVENGLYLWGVPVDGRILVNTVGITIGSIPARVQANMDYSLKGQDREHADPVAFREGRRVSIARGPDFRAEVEETYRAMVCFVAPMSSIEDVRLKQCESTLIRRCRAFDESSGNPFLSNGPVSRRDLGEIIVASQLPSDCEYTCPAIPCEASILESGEIVTGAVESIPATQLAADASAVPATSEEVVAERSGIDPSWVEHPVDPGNLVRYQGKPLPDLRRESWRAPELSPGELEDCTRYYSGDQKCPQCGSPNWVKTCAYRDNDRGERYERDVWVCRGCGRLVARRNEEHRYVGVFPTG